MKKTIFTTIIVTIEILIISFGLLFLGFRTFSPKTLAGITENLGYHDYSIKMYERHYKKTKDINSLYLLVNKAIIYEKGSIVRLYGEDLFNHSKYNELITSLDKANFDENESVLANLKLSDNDNRLKSRYVKYLAENVFEKAFDFAFLDFAESNVDKELNFAFVGLASFVNQSRSELFISDSKKQNNLTAADMIYSKYQELKTSYESDKNANSIYVNAQTSSKLVDMLQFMLLLDSKTSGETYDNDALQAELTTIFAEYQNYIR